MVKNVVILGSTGSIGQNTLKIIQKFPQQFKVLGLSGGKNAYRLYQQIKQFKPEYAAVYDREAYEELSRKVKNCHLLYGEQGIKQLCGLKKASIILNAIIGSSGLKYTVAAIINKKRIALANKESYVMAGDIINQLIKKYKVDIIPVDSEHSAIFHLLLNQKKECIEKVILTASGGPFRRKHVREFIEITLEDTLKHPVWSMGSKITVDSATLINKGFEVIEAHYLFNIPYDKIAVIIHPQSIIHSLVQTLDGEFYAQMSTPDMKNPILNALSYPDMNKYPFEKLKLDELDHLSFQQPDHKKFPLLDYCFKIGKKGGNLPAALCIADDIVVERFLNNRIKFHEIPDQIMNMVKHIKYVEKPDIDYIFWLEKYMKEKFI